MAFRKKAKFIEIYKPDILIVPECEHPDKLKKELQYVHPNEVFWYGKNLNKGLGIFSFTDYKIKLSDCHDDNFRMVLPLEITNNIDKYSVFAIWANNPQDRDFQYIGQVWKALIHYQQKIEMTKTLFIGDFNSNSVWDKPRRIVNHSTVVDILVNSGIESAYHKYFGLSHGKEEHPTLFMYRHFNKPYHIDYCFASLDMLHRLRKVEVGAFENWKSLSDHMPLIIEFE